MVHLVLHGGEGDQSIAFLSFCIRVQKLYLVADDFPESCVVDVDDKQVLCVYSVLLQQVSLFDVLREALNDVVLVGLRQRFDLADDSRNGGLLDQQAGVEPRLIFLPEAFVDLGDFVSAVEQLILFVDVRECLFDDRVDGKAGRAYHE